MPGSQEDIRGTSDRCAHRTHLAHKTVVEFCPGDGDRLSPSSTRPVTDVTATARVATPIDAQTSSDGAQAFRSAIRQHGLSEEVSQFLFKSWRPGTQTQYDIYIKRWYNFCSQRDVSPFLPDLNAVLCFLLELFNGSPLYKPLGYSAINTARSALSTFVTIERQPIGQHPVVCRFLKAVFNERPALPRYTMIWDTDILLRYLRSLSPVRKITLKLLTQKLAVLLLLLAGQRCQTVHKFSISQMNLTSSYVQFNVKGLLKTSRPGHHCGQVSYKAFAPDRRLCVVTVLRHYINRTQELRADEDSLFLTLRPPHGPASKDTLRRWVRDCMQAAGIDMQMFSTHSTRAAATSKVVDKIPLMTIIRTAGWSNQSTFAKYYKKPITTQYDFGAAVLHQVPSN